MMLQSQHQRESIDSASTAPAEDAGLSNLFITNKLIEILVHFIRANHQQPAVPASTDASEIFQFLYAHLNEKITLTMLSQKFYMSESASAHISIKQRKLSILILIN